MKTINRQELKTIFFDVKKRQELSKPIILYGENDYERIRVIKEVFGDNIITFDTNPVVGSQYFVDGNNEFKETDASAIKDFQHRFHASAFDESLNIIIYQVSNPVSKLNLQYYLAAAKTINKPLVCLAVNSDIDEFPREFTKSFEQLQLITTKECWLEWACSKDNKGHQIINELVTDFLANSDDEIFYLPKTPLTEMDNNEIAIYKNFRTFAEDWYYLGKHYRSKDSLLKAIKNGSWFRSVKYRNIIAQSFTQYYKI